MRIHVEVTAEDIAQGEPEDCKNCPIALALRRAEPDSNPWVGVTAFSINNCPLIILPENAQSFIQDFDNGEPVGPIAFDLEVPDGPLTERV